MWTVLAAMLRRTARGGGKALENILNRRRSLLAARAIKLGGTSQEGDDPVAVGQATQWDA